MLADIIRQYVSGLIFLLLGLAFLFLAPRHIRGAAEKGWSYPGSEKTIRWIRRGGVFLIVLFAIWVGLSL